MWRCYRYISRRSWTAGLVVAIVSMRVALSTPWLGYEADVFSYLSFPHPRYLSLLFRWAPAIPLGGQGERRSMKHEKDLAANSKGRQPHLIPLSHRPLIFGCPLLARGSKGGQPCFAMRPIRFFGDSQSSGRSKRLMSLIPREKREQIGGRSQRIGEETWSGGHQPMRHVDRSAFPTHASSCDSNRRAMGINRPMLLRVAPPR